jgi:muramidase (phage lysozyme)
MTGNYITPGALCGTTSRPIDAGTMVRASSPAPGYRGKTGSPHFHSKAKADQAERQRQHLREDRAYAENPNVKAFLAAISQAEGGADNLMYGGVRGKNDRHVFTDFSTHPMIGVKGPTPAGSYQINVPTWRDIGNRLGLHDFTTETQALMAIEMLREAGVIEDVVAGDLIKALPKAAIRWAALPQGPGQPNAHSEQPFKSYEVFLKYYKDAGGKVKDEIVDKAKSIKNK